jgi:photosystem II stability/assembly factor-like uncharacterized protein
MKRILALIVLSLPFVAIAQDVAPDSFLAALSPRNVGPVTMSGRIVELAVYEKEPRIFYVASASGGLWKTTSGGVEFEPLFQDQSSVSLGAVAVSQSDPNIVWVGTGEDTSRNSVAWGDGVYRSLDGGKTWQHMGLKETMHISRIAIDPKDPNVVTVGALGRLWGENPERGIYQTTDGGKTWKHVLPGDARTGCIDLQVDPKNPKNMLAAMWQRRRYAWDFISGGPGSGLWKSTDGGRSWRKLRRGLPSELTGRIGLSYFRNNPNVVVATIEYKIDPKAEEKLDPKRPNDRGSVRTYAGGTFRSTDGGESWERVNFLNPRPFYFSLPIQDPTDEKRIYLGSDTFWMSDDAGKTFNRQRATVHPDHHDAWINPRDNHHMLLATDGGVFETRDRAVTWRMLKGLPVGQFYAVAYDFRRPYWVYGGLQDNGSWGIPTQTRQGGPGFWDATMTTYGDGFHVQVDPTDPNTVYSESQGGAISRTDMRTGLQRGIRPRPAPGERLRYNWSTPFILSPHNPKTLYIGANRLFKSVNQGDDWQAISPDLTTNDPLKQNVGALSVTPEDTGAERHCTIITISESPRKQGLLYVGTDDGLVHVSENDGRTWTDIGGNIKGLPRNTWCSRVLASKWTDSRVYALFDGHRSNDFKPYIFVSDDYGKNWRALDAGLPEGDCLYSLAEGEQNGELMFLGSEMGLRVSLDSGKTWKKLTGKFPTVAVHDLKVHPRDLDLIVGTHGRSIWTIDVSGLEGITSNDYGRNLALSRPQDVLYMGRVVRSFNVGDGIWFAPNTQPGTRIFYYMKEPVEGGVTITISDASGKRTEKITGMNEAGLNVAVWNGRLEGRPAEPGDYRVVVKAGAYEETTSVRVIDATGS